MRFPVNHDETADKVAQQMLLWTCASFAAPATLRRMFQYVEAWGVLNGLNRRLPDAHVAAAALLGATATIDMLEVLLRTRAKAAAGGPHNRDEKGTALIALSNSGDSGASAPFALFFKFALVLPFTPSCRPCPRIFLAIRELSEEFIFLRLSLAAVSGGFK